MVAIYVMLATSFNLIIGFAGLMSIAHPIFFALGAYGSGLVARELGLPIAVCVAAVAVIAGLEVPHAHLHLVPIDTEGDLSFAKADPSPAPEALDHAAERLRDALRAAGHGSAVPDD